MYRTAALAAALASLFGQAAAQGVYTCTDSKGRRLTADRPIMDCIDREQLKVDPSGLKRVIPPNPTAAERAAEETRTRLALEERTRAEELKKRERALVTRYPNRAVHDGERAQALALVDSVTAAAQIRTKDLLNQRRFLDGEVEFYKPDPSRMPAKLKRQIEEVEAQLAAQKRFVVDQEVEKVRVNSRFDEELSRLKPLWAIQGATLAPASAPAGKPAASRPASSSAAR
jgi:hypothetical protein